MKTENVKTESGCIWWWNTIFHPTLSLYIIVIVGKSELKITCPIATIISTQNSFTSKTFLCNKKNYVESSVSI